MHNALQVLLHHIRDTLPDLKVKLNAMLATSKIEYARYGDSILLGPGGQVKCLIILDIYSCQGAFLLQLLTKFSTSFCHTIDGTCQHISLTELYVYYCGIL